MYLPQVAYISNSISIAGGFEEASSIDRRGQLFSWGMGALGNLGIGDTSAGNRSIPMLNTLKNIIEISRASSAIIAKDVDGKVYGAGHNSVSKLGNGGTENSVYSFVLIISLIILSLT